MAHQPTSAITMAFANSAPSMESANQLADKAAATFHRGAKHASGLPPTPPNSLSPNLPAQLARGHASSPSLMAIDHDIDLQDAVEHAKAQDQPQMAPVPLSKGALSGLETSHVINPIMLANDHLPGIMLGHGPVAIRHIIGCLTQSVPGFSRIPPAKARRLVVAALESRTAGGRDGAVDFEKVGWGRWDAHKRGEVSASRSREMSSHSRLSPPVSESSSFGASYAGSAYPAAKRDQLVGDKHVFSWTGSSMPSFDEGLEHMSMSDYGPDNMSLDGSETGESASDSAGDETESEDWASMGAEALRKASITTAASGSVRRNYNLLCIPGRVYNRRFSSSTNNRAHRRPSQTRLGKSVPTTHGRSGAAPSSANMFSTATNNVYNDTDNDVMMELDQSPEEREAVQALLSMGSM